MPRTARKRSESGYYHAMFRGNGKQIVFEDDADRRRFLKLLSVKAEKDGMRIIAWCLMDNHVHVLLEDSDDHLSDFVHAVLTAYALYFNARTGHVGSVFQPRFASVPIADDAQLLSAVRYIHDNPVKAGLAGRDSYRWSSYHEYLGEEDVCDTSIVLDLVGGKRAFEEFSSGCQPEGYSFRSGKRVLEEESRDVAIWAAGGRSPAEVKALSMEERDEILARMRGAGMSIRQMERQTGIGRGAIAMSIARSGVR